MNLLSSQTFRLFFDTLLGDYTLPYTHPFVSRRGCLFLSGSPPLNVFIGAATSVLGRSLSAYGPPMSEYLLGIMKPLQILFILPCPCPDEKVSSLSFFSFPAVPTPFDLILCS